MNTSEYITHSPAETRRVAAALARQLQPPAIVALFGDIGAGKTCFVQGLAAGLGLRETVTSPTFIIINEYPGPVPLYHMDLYRLPEAEDALQAGIEEYFERPGITVIEWAERAEALLPPSAIRVRLENAGPRQRRILITAGNRCVTP